LRLMLGHEEAKELLKEAGSPQWSAYLVDSEYYPSLSRDLGVLVRKYSWPHPFVIVELWGVKEDLASAAVKLAGRGAEGNLRLQLLLRDGDVPKVESLPGNPRVSQHPVIRRPLSCRSLTLEAPESECKEAIIAFVRIMGEQ